MNRKLIFITILLLLITTTGCQNKEAEINILATTDLHSIIPETLVEYVGQEREKDPNLLLVDAGDFFDSQTTDMQEWFTGQKFVGLKDSKPQYQTLEKPMDGESPISKMMGDLKYDAVVLGNHEFVGPKKILDRLVSEYENNEMPIVSANIYETSGKNYVKPYVMKNVKTKEGNVKVGILGLTLKEIGERSEFKNPEKDKEARFLQNQQEYKGTLYANDLVEDAKKWVAVMEKEKPDIIVAAVHSGEEPKKARNPGNRIKELATTVDGIDAIVAGHTHKKIEQHDYKNSSGEKVIVTQPASHGEYISKINFSLVNKSGKWKITDKNSSLKNFEEVNLISSNINNEKSIVDLNASILNNLSNDDQSIILNTGDSLDIQTPYLKELYAEFKSNDSKKNDSLQKIDTFKNLMDIGMSGGAIVLGEDNLNPHHDNPLIDYKFIDYINSEFGIELAISANIYTKSNKNYTKPYIIKEVDTREGKIKVGILGLTESSKKNIGDLQIKDPITEANKHIKNMQKENTDIIVAAINSTENTNKENSLEKELATKSNDIDVIFSKNTKVNSTDEVYNNISGEEVLVIRQDPSNTSLAKIKLNLEKENGKWIITSNDNRVEKIK
ncbi:metallophosphoesterase [Metaclostridioides mangenotii]|uniref:metallophosphoesterase n=1 Tax=Metaclostridioides mangenotii TaxID=1540 RepID=UPI0028EBBA9D|nr:metallophosphoesterase [Clostridioides mangenotii]